MTHRDIDDGMGFGGLVESPEERRERKKEESKQADRFGPRVAIGSAIEEAMTCLPRDYSIEMTIVKGHFAVAMFLPDDTVKIFSKSELISDNIRDALQHALGQIG